MNEKQKHEYAQWGANNWDVLNEMHEDYLAFGVPKNSPKPPMPLHLFTLAMWHDGQDIVANWEGIQHQKMLERN
tara:strand:- start:28 stop:249 length:222 start_codon:yes stop_codon:yes gene_type:complete